MRSFVRFTFAAVFGWFIMLSCKPANNDDVIIEGTVTDAKTGNAVINANIEIESPADLRKFAKSDSSGKYTITGIDIDEITTITVTASAAKYQDKKETLKIAPKDVIRGFDFKLSLTGSGTTPPGGGGDDSNSVDGPPTGAAVIILEKIQHTAINIIETGGIVNSAFTFQVQDSSGRALNLDNQVEVEFTILEGPGGNEGIQPIVAKTNDSGQVTSNLFSGNTAGVVQIQAKIERPEVGLTLVSSPVAIAIHGGFPVLEYFSIAPEVANSGGYNHNGIETKIVVYVGDKFSNPVKPGTAVYFETTGGIIQGSSTGHTDDNGKVEVKLLSTDPRPSDAETINGISMGGRVGLGTVTASTIDENSQTIKKSTNVLFSTNTALISATPTTFDLDPNGGASFDYTVTDLNGNPMPAGTLIKVSAGEGIEITGASDIKLGDHIHPGTDITDFNFSIRDTDDENNNPADLTLSITVTAPNGNVTTYNGIRGIRRKTF